MMNDVFGFNNQDYFENPMGKVEGIRDHLEQFNSDAILLGAPSFIPIDKNNKFPMASLRVTQSLKAYASPFKSFAIIAVMDLGTNTLIADFVVEQKFVKIPLKPNASPPPEGKFSDGSALDLIARNIIPKSIGDYYSTVLILGSRSNRVRTVLANEALQHDETKLTKTLETHSRNTAASATTLKIINPKSVGQESQSPQIPDSAGISAKVSKIKFLDSEKPKPVLFVSFRIPSKPNRDVQSFNILATGTRTPSPLGWQTGIPINTEEKAGAFLQGQFSIDLDSMIGDKGGQTWFFYVFSDTEISTPASVELQ